MFTSVQIVMVATVIGALTQGVKWSAKRLLKGRKINPTVTAVSEVFLKRLLPYTIALLAYLGTPWVFEDMARSLDIDSRYSLYVALFCGALSAIVYTTVRDWARTASPGK